jgi:hypothetical protein
MENLFTQKELIQIGVSLLAGGAFGAVIKVIYDAYRSRIQPVGYRIRFVKIFKDTLGSSGLKATLQLNDDVETRHFQNLFIAEITLVNKGNVHFDEFSFGIELGGGDEALFTESITPNRHRVLMQTTQVALGSTAKEVDFVCRPFNRKDVYTVKVFIAIPPDKSEPDDINLSSTHPVKFVDLTNYERAAVAILNVIAKENVVTITRVHTE